MGSFGQVLKAWRSKRRFSQLALGLEAGVSARHVSYLETGKAKPSRQMVFQLANALSVPVNARNTWLTSAGYAPVYRRRPLDDGDLEPFVKIVRRLLDHHDPFPGWALNDVWEVAYSNRAGARLLSQVGLGVGGNLLERLAVDPSLGGKLKNWKDVVNRLSKRVQAEAAKRADARVEELAQRLCFEDDVFQEVPSDSPIVPTVFEIAGCEISLASVQANFNTAEDLTLQDLRIELFFPICFADQENLSQVLDLN